jgi:ribosomal-protein-alanine N-acetyltransferase
LIARIWKGAVRTEDGDAYAKYMQNTGISGYANTPGNRGVWMLRRDLNENTEFLMFTLWDSLEAVKAFAGADYENAVFYPEDERFLVERDSATTHYVVDTQALPTPGDTNATGRDAAATRTRLERERVTIRRPEAADSERLLALYLRNRSFLEPWTPHRSESFYTRAAQERAIADACAAWGAGSAYEFLIESDEGELVGRVALSSVARGPFQNAHLGYFVDEASTGRGYATEAVRLALEFAFVDAQVHRVQAAVTPQNTASIRVLEKLGFREEGLAARYLQIAGAWGDHRIFALTREEHSRPKRDDSC